MPSTCGGVPLAIDATLLPGAGSGIKLQVRVPSRAARGRILMTLPLCALHGLHGAHGLSGPPGEAVGGGTVGGSGPIGPPGPSGHDGMIGPHGNAGDRGPQGECGTPTRTPRCGWENWNIRIVWVSE